MKFHSGQIHMGNFEVAVQIEAEVQKFDNEAHRQPDQIFKVCLINCRRRKFDVSLLVPKFFLLSMCMCAVSPPWCFRIVES